jgi:hypothetical protein
MQLLPASCCLIQVYLAMRTATCVSEKVLTSQFDKVKAAFPAKTEEEVFRVLQRRVIPANIAGRSTYHYHKLQDLLQMTKDWRLPHLLLTLTADEHSELRWTSMDNLEEFVGKYVGDKLWSDLPVECSQLFRDHLQHILKEYILRDDGKGILGRVKHHFTRYEVQMRGSLHVHILLWLDPADVDRVTNEIMASLPLQHVQDATGKWVPVYPTEQEQDLPQAILYRQVQRKQLHKPCNTWGPNSNTQKPQ